MKSKISGTAGPRTYFLCSIFTRFEAMAAVFSLPKSLKTLGLWFWYGFDFP